MTMSLFPGLVAESRPKAAPVAPGPVSCPLFDAQADALGLGPVDDLERLRRRRDEFVADRAEAVWSVKRAPSMKQEPFKGLAARHGMGSGMFDLLPTLVERLWLAHRMGGFGFKRNAWTHDGLSGQDRLAWSADTLRVAGEIVDKALQEGDHGHAV